MGCGNIENTVHGIKMKKGAVLKHVLAVCH